MSVWMAFLSTAVAAVPCAAERVVPLDGGVVVSLDEGDLPRGSLVLRSEAATCAVGTWVEVVAVDPWYRGRRERVPVGLQTCVRTEELQAIEASAAVVMGDLPGAPSVAPLPWGTLLPVSCPEEREAEVLAGSRRISTSELAAVDRVRGVYEQHFGPLARHQVGWTDWGYVSLPLVHFLSDAEREAAMQSEELHTEEQREKATSALGDTAESYTHFLGADPRLTDLWAEPDTVIALLELIAAWRERCPGLAEARWDTCTVQVGDLAFYGPHRPDPLGHRTHYRGECVDLRLFRQDGSRYESYWNRADDREGFVRGYSLELNSAFVELAVAQARGAPVYFNDPAVLAAVEGLQAERRHDDHIHWCAPPR